MPTQLDHPRSHSDDRQAAAPERPVDLAAGRTLEVDPLAGTDFVVDLGPTRSPVASPPPPEPPAAPEPAPTPAAGPKLVRPRRRGKARWDAPAWAVSALIHVGILGLLAAIATSSGAVVRQLTSLDSALVTKDGGEEELTPVLADPADVPRDQAVGDTGAESAGPSVAYSGGSPGALVLKSTGRAMGARNALPSVGTVAAPSNIGLVSATPTRDLGGGGLIGGDVTNTVAGVGDALDQLAKEILRHLSQHKLTVVWMFDESESMRDDQKAIKSKFDRVVNELQVNENAADAGKGGGKKGGGPPLTHAIVGFGDDIHFEQEKPTGDINLIGKAIDRLRIDSTGKENTMSAIMKVIGHYDNLIGADKRLLLVIATDESGDDGDYVEEARAAALKNKVPIYVIGRQSLFGTDRLRIRYIDPVTKDEYWVDIRRGPETADVEALQYDGIHGRWDEIPSGFAPYELARMAKDTGGIYFLLPSEEELRIHRREKAYSMSTLKEYVPDYESRQAYVERRNKSELRRTLRDVIALTKDFPYRHHYSVLPEEMLTQVNEDGPVVTERLNALIAVEKKLRDIEKSRNREPEKRWQAAYDLMLAQVVIYQIKAYEYRANLLEMAAKVPKPKMMPSPELSVVWTLDHNGQPMAPRESTEKVYAEAMRLCKLVIERHPNTPWADLAQDEIDRGFSVRRGEWDHKHSAQYEERKKLIPKF